MAIDLIQFKQIEAAKVTGNALSAGYPDLLIDFPEAPKRADSAVVAKHHGVNFEISDSHTVFKEMGLELTVIDRAKLQGCEHIVDLNERQMLPFYDLVIDPGTSEHCFNIPQALVNLAGAVKVGGCISQALPISMFNHGYWNVNPVALVDFYEANGFKIEQGVMRVQDGVFALTVQRLKGVPDGTVTVLLARRVEVKPFTWPQQKIKGIIYFTPALILNGIFIVHNVLDSLEVLCL